MAKRFGFGKRPDKDWLCEYAASGCNYPEGECSGHCAGKYKQAQQLVEDAVTQGLAMSVDGEGTDQKAGEVKRLPVARADIARLGQALEEVVDSVGDGLTVAELVGTLECLKNRIIRRAGE